ncbi:hypothetical protein B0H34DRAFT_791917 [Crassisporium funariophilum]|nr:hypothetical protein B0H34DRAFT_791917 [Crassisporium funariophilum]
MEVVPGTYGALLLGAFFASGLSGIVTVQSIVYFKLYPDDRRLLKALVIAVWGLDLAHSCFVWGAMWDYLITNFGRTRQVDFIPMSIALSVIFTAVLTFFAQMFFAHRIFRLSKGNLLLTAPIVVLAAARLTAASGMWILSTWQLMQLSQYFSDDKCQAGKCGHVAKLCAFQTTFPSNEEPLLCSINIALTSEQWLFSVGLALSSTVDILVTLSLFFLLQKSRKQSLSLNHIIDSLILYAFEIGSLTSAATVVSMICWLVLENNLIFLGLHFIIGKLYANSLLATLNTRQEIGKSRTNVNAHDLMDLEILRNPQGIQFFNPLDQVADMQYISHVEVNVEKTVQFDDTR